MSERRGPFHNLSGPRLPTGPKPARECWRCTEVRRVLLDYRIVRNGVTFGVVQLCGVCISGMPLDPDPLDVTEAA